MMNKSLITKPQRQTGVVLVISLVMLLALTLIGITSSNVTGLETKMAANSKDRNVAFQAAESALRSAEAMLIEKRPFDYEAKSIEDQGGAPYQGYYTIVGAGAGGAILPWATPETNAYSSVNWSGTKVILSDASKPLAPKYIVEKVKSDKVEASGDDGLEVGVQQGSKGGETATFRVTVRGFGNNANSVATVQSIVKVTYPDK